MGILDGHEGLIPDWLELVAALAVFAMFILAVWDRRNDNGKNTDI